MDDRLLTAEDKAHPAFADFTLEMHGRLYGPEPTRDAWQWFLRGWQRGLSTLPVR